MTLFVMNPNASPTVTDGIDAAMAPLRATAGVPIRCTTLETGPKGIETQAQADKVVPALLAQAESVAAEATGYVIACFGDPGLHALRDHTAKPVIGIQEAAVLTALSLGHRFGVVSILPGSIPRHLRAFGAMGVMDRLAGDRALGLGVADLADPTKTEAAMIATAHRLAEDGADALILGCAGMTAYRDRVEAATGLPTVEPCQAAAAMALGRIALNLTHRPEAPPHAR